MFDAPKKREPFISRNFVLAVLVALAAICLVVIAFDYTKPAKAQGGVMVLTRCVTLEDIREVMWHSWHDQEVFADTKAAKILQALNESPPPTSVMAERVMLAEGTRPDGALRHAIYLETGDCVDGFYLLRPGTYQMLLSTTKGQPL